MDTDNVMNKEYGQFALRVSLGMLFFLSGVNKLMGPEGFMGALDGWGFPLTSVLAWVVILAEVIGGATLLAGYKVKYAAPPLFIILLVALIVVNLGTSANISEELMGTGFWWHVVGMAGLYSLFVTGPGFYSVDEE